MKVAFLMLFTLVNIALTGFGAILLMWSPMLFDSGGTDDNLKWAIFWSIWFFPVAALICVFLPWLFQWLKWSRAALVVSAIPAAYAIIFFAAISVMDAMRP
jgi:hypothetical protein